MTDKKIKKCAPLAYSPLKPGSWSMLIHLLVELGANYPSMVVIRKKAFQEVNKVEVSNSLLRWPFRKRRPVSLANFNTE